MMNINTEFILALIGAFTIGLASYKGLVWVYKRTPRISFKNPLKQYIRKQVIEYLKELKDE